MSLFCGPGKHIEVNFHSCGVLRPIEAKAMCIFVGGLEDAKQGIFAITSMKEKLACLTCNVYLILLIMHNRRRFELEAVGFDAQDEVLNCDYSSFSSRVGSFRSSCYSPAGRVEGHQPDRLHQPAS